MKRINMRVEEANDAHVKCSLFSDGHFNGKLIFSQDEYSFFSRIIAEGCEELKVENTSNDTKFVEYHERRIGRRE